MVHDRSVGNQHSLEQLLINIDGSCAFHIYAIKLTYVLVKNMSRKVIALEAMFLNIELTCDCQHNPYHLICGRWQEDQPQAKCVAANSLVPINLVATPMLVPGLGSKLYWFNIVWKSITLLIFPCIAKHSVFKEMKSEFSQDYHWISRE